MNDNTCKRSIRDKLKTFLLFLLFNAVFLVGCGADSNGASNDDSGTSDSASESDLDDNSGSGEDIDSDENFDEENGDDSDSDDDSEKESTSQDDADDNDDENSADRDSEEEDFEEEDSDDEESEEEQAIDNPSDDGHSDDESEDDSDEDAVTVDACPFECMASFQCENVNGKEVEGSCESINRICCEPGEDTNSDEDTGLDSETDDDSNPDSDENNEQASDTSAEDEPDTNSDDDDLFDVDYELSTAIPTVGIVEWSISESINDAIIQFGPADGDFEFSAPVDVNENPHRTLLLGMKPNKTYKFVIVAEGDETYTSALYEITTEPQRTGLPAIDMQDHGGTSYEGFTVACTLATMGTGGGGSRNFAYIFDKDGDMVWWFELDMGEMACSRIRMSYDGKYMWTGNVNVMGSDGKLFRMSMDGLDTKEFSISEYHHDFAMLENNNVLIVQRSAPGGGIGGGGEPADLILELDQNTGSTTEIYNQDNDFQSLISASGSHTNAINFVPHLNAFSFSMLNFDTIAVVSYPEGNLLHTFGGPQSDYSAMTWSRQHSHHLTENGDFYVFNNQGSNGGSSALKFEISSNAAELVMDYAPGIASSTFGETRELPNGNIFVTYSNAATIHEIGADGQLIQSIDTGSGIGYAARRTSLYGPPPPWGE